MAFETFLLKIKELSEQGKLICPLPLPLTPWADRACSCGLTLPTHQQLPRKGAGGEMILAWKPGAGASSGQAPREPAL